MAQFYFQSDVLVQPSSRSGVLCEACVVSHQVKEEMCVTGALDSSAGRWEGSKNQETIFSSETLSLNDIQSSAAFDEQINSS